MTNTLPNLKVESILLPKGCIVCGDPARAKSIASQLENHKQIAQNREYHTYSGTWNGVEIGVVSHGVGAPGAAVCFEELIQGGVETLIRVGTAGSYQDKIIPGSLVISTASARCDGLTSQLVPQGFPAVADRCIIEALSKAGSEFSKEMLIHEGITLTLDAFYSGVLEFPHEIYKRAGILAVEMENAALFVIAALRGVRAGAILAIDGYADSNLRENYNPHTEIVNKAVIAETKIALNALAQIIKDANVT
ncbi:MULTISPECIES: nucleoside phosphorylase [unclassified Bacillus (in: firmicutes)]|uniref:nucleoside phosphorylase n=1 Tax=unclassified Bacillus (in: firmicutes) TaxID=185979 RepID=UPI0008E49237|nr:MULTISPECIES: nucleoside phosphorylase [unclassified Bacillus (in: firmicutes)]SFA87494.1 uridine phosphorylase [Bacillus sp. UNCCL13]SFQ84274.1 uridine phosphorylase [Bacillus sp. cl95]